MAHSRGRFIVLTLLAASAVGAYVSLSRGTGPAVAYPPVRVPADNPTTEIKIALGRRLFYDTDLSFNGSIACASCHQQAFAFADPRPRSIGATGELTQRNAMTLTNVAFNGRFTWANNAMRTLEQQALIPLTQDHPLEMGVQKDERGILDRLVAKPPYREWFHAAFPDDSNPVTLTNVVKAIGSFERTLISFAAPYDRFVAGDTAALSDAAQRGLTSFRSSKLRCTRCHEGVNFRITPGHRVGADDESVAYHNTGLYSLQNSGAYPSEDRGLIEVTGERADMGRFKAPTLRNIEITAPYFHDGSAATLEDVIAVYAAGGRVIATGANAGDGRANPYKSEHVAGFEISKAEQDDLIEFLKSLTDRAFLTNPAFANPFIAAQ